MTTSEIIGVLKEARKYSINYVDTQIAQINEFIQMTKTNEHSLRKKQLLSGIPKILFPLRQDT